MPMTYRGCLPGSDAAPHVAENLNFENPNFADDPEYRILSTTSETVVWGLSALSLRAEPGSCAIDELLLLRSHGASVRCFLQDSESSETLRSLPAISSTDDFPPVATAAGNNAAAPDLWMASKESSRDGRASAPTDVVHQVIVAASSDMAAADLGTSSSRKEVGVEGKASASICAADGHLLGAAVASSNAAAAAASNLWVASKEMEMGEDDVASSAMSSAHHGSRVSTDRTDRSHARACLSSSWSSGFCMLDVVDEDHPWEEAARQEPDSVSVSASSSSSLSSMENDPTEMEVQSTSRDGTSELFTSVGASSSSLSSSLSSPSPPPPPRKGLSQFYSGKSRSFSCLGDVVALKDIVKPENPYAKKRKHNVGGGSGSLDRPPRLPPLQKGTASISKKTVHNGGKSKLALGVALSSVQNIELQGSQASPWVQRQQQPLMVSRSYSLSDLQGVAGSHSSV